MQLKKALIDRGYQHTRLRPHLRKILSHLERVSSTKKVITGGDRKNYQQEAFDIIVRTYAAIGVPVRRPEDLFKYPVWWVYENNEGVMVAFSAFKKTRYGLKAGLSGFDGSSEGKRIAVDNLRNKFNTNGIYGEVSHKVKDIALAAGAPKIPVEYVAEILGKDIEPLGDGYSYRRSITGVGEVVKVLIGKPNFNFPDKSSNEDDEDRTLISEEECDLHHHMFCSMLD